MAEVRETAPGAEIRPTLRSNAGGRRALQVVVTILSFVPILAGSGGVLLGPSFVGANMISPDGTAVPDVLDLDSHFRYLSGIFLGIGLAFLATVPRIEAATFVFRLLTAFIVIGGLARLLSLIELGPPSTPHLVGLGLELVVVPSLAVWQTLVARAAQRAQS